MSFVDIEPYLDVASEQTGCPKELILATAIAESALNPLAERWGSRTREAKNAILLEDWDALYDIIQSEWADISFGMSQCIVQYHYYGDGSATVENCLHVRNGVFADTGRDIIEIGNRMRSNLDLAMFRNSEGSLPRQVFQSEEPIYLAALVKYNSGSIAGELSGYWDRYAGNVAGYIQAISQAKELLGSDIEAELRNKLGYLQGDVAAAIRNPIESVMKRLKKGSANYNKLEAALHAVETLENE
jgi:hypothetical protein